MVDELYQVLLDWWMESSWCAAERFLRQGNCFGASVKPHCIILSVVPAQISQRISLLVEAFNQTGQRWSRHSLSTLRPPGTIIASYSPFKSSYVTMNTISWESRPMKERDLHMDLLSWTAKYLEQCEFRENTGVVSWGGRFRTVRWDDESEWLHPARVRYHTHMLDSEV